MRAGGEIEFEFLGEGDEGGNFVATAKVIPMLTTLLAKGEIEEAMRLYEGSEASVAASLLEQCKTMSSTSIKNLGLMFSMARDFVGAAKVFEFGKRWADAGKSYEQGSDFLAAARCHEKAGDLKQAAAALERAGKPDLALEVHQRAGPSEAMAECMARQHLYFDAAAVYRQLANVRGEVEALRLVPLNSPNRITAVKRLGDLLEHHGHVAPSAQLLMETVQQVPGAQNDQELLNALVRRFEMLGRFEHAERVRGHMHKMLGSGMPAAPAAAPSAPRPMPVSAPRAAPPPQVVQGSVVAAPRPAGPPPGGSAADPFASLVDPFGGAGAGGGGPGSLPGTSVPSGGPAPTPMADGYGQLKAIPIFGELALPDMKDLHRISESIVYAPGFTVIEQGAQGAGLVVILMGNVQVLRVDGAKTTPLATLGPGSYVGELSLVDEAPTSARVVATGPVRALTISRERFQQYLYTHEQAALRIYMLFTRTLAERLRQANKR